ncbi:MAG: alpha-glucan family phosphorylase [Deltaproteobacteria bacterium]|nr:alpha-glucan family phosphorylase [Deltaproteobacteria bacterium]
MQLRLPEPLVPLATLAYDLWWSWDESARALFDEVDPEGWARSGHNPVAMLASISYARAMDLSENDVFRLHMEEVLRRWHQLRAENRPPPPMLPGADRQHPVAYFCMEYGIHECLPIYAGGLGVLAGDHLKSASDLDLPLVAVGLFYQEGYFRQKIERNEQIEVYRKVDPNLLPLRPVLGPDGKRLFVEVPENHHTYLAQAWEVQVGRVRLFLLDANVPGATWYHQQYSRRLYGGASDTRLGQEILLGIGGVRLLRALGLDPVTFHMNEGHAAFLTLELVREALAQGVPVDRALEETRSRCVFTTHTPVLAGHDRFTWDQVQGHLAGYREATSLPAGFVMDLGRVWPGDVGAPLCNTILALRMSRAANAVSAIHGEVSREMWKDLYTGQPLPPVAQVAPAPPPARIGHVTNGVHPKTWMSPACVALLDRYAPIWDTAFQDPEGWHKAVRRIPAVALWDARRAARRVLVEWLVGRGLPRLNPEALTIGFARRFALYKRANLIFSDPDRLVRILDEGVQIVFGGKAHPADMRGQSLLSEIVRWCEDPRFQGRVLFLPNYNLKAARMLTQGCDLWLNNPRRPYEASGTSGQKAAIQGVLNLSILDGWWAEAWDGTHGWAIRPPDLHRPQTSEQDPEDARALYHALEDEVLPAWQNRNGSGIPLEWVERMRQSIAVCLPQYDARRMVREYAGIYTPPSGG